MIPRKFPCQPIVYDATRPDDPYWQNPLIPMEFLRLTSWMNGVNGAIAGNVGAVVFKDFKLADNKEAGIMFEIVQDVKDDVCYVDGGFSIGKTPANTALNGASPKGVSAARSENFSIRNMRFYNYNFNDAAALTDCSHCNHIASQDSGARTIKTQNLGFDSSVTQRIRFGFPFNGIFYDLDGSLTNKGPNTYVSAFYEHNVQPECEVNMAVYSGIVCNNQV